MAENNLTDINDPKTMESIEKFLKAYKDLAPAGKKAFESEIEKMKKKMDLKTKTLYDVLVRSAKLNHTSEMAFKEMAKTAIQFKS